jgi:hypothetical protein
MTAQSLRRKSLPLLLCLSLAASSVSAAPPQRFKPSRAASPAPPTLLDRTWSLLRNLVADTGCMLDPNGGHCSSSTSQLLQPPAGADTGCMLDPSGVRHCSQAAAQPN